MSGRQARLPSVYTLAWHGESLLYRPAEATVEWGSPAEQVGEDLCVPPDRFEPRSLTVAVGGPCPMACSYCYGRRDGHRQNGSLSAAPLPAVTAAARVVAASCQQLGLPLVVGLHGASEPLQDRRWAEEVTDAVRKVAAEHQLPLHLACTTSGVIEPETAQWLANELQSVTVSLDGPPRLHDRQRPLASGEPSYHRVAATLHRLLGSQRRPEKVSIRSTITCQNVTHQVEMVEHILARFPVDRLLFHPAYSSIGPCSSTPSPLAPAPDQLVGQLLEARRLARRAGVELVLASSRAGELHGRFCPILQHNLTVTPSGHATACFLALDGDTPWSRDMLFGGYDPAADRFVIDEAKLESLLGAVSALPSRCRTCFNVRHCARGCPDQCPLAPAEASRAPADTSCQVARQVAFATLLEAAGVELDRTAIAELQHQLPPVEVV